MYELIWYDLNKIDNEIIFFQKISASQYLFNRDTISHYLSRSKKSNFFTIYCSYLKRSSHLIYQLKKK